MLRHYRNKHGITSLKRRDTIPQTEGYTPLPPPLTEGYTPPLPQPLTEGYTPPPPPPPHQQQPYTPEQQQQQQVAV